MYTSVLKLLKFLKKSSVRERKRVELPEWKKVELSEGWPEEKKRKEGRNV